MKNQKQYKMLFVVWLLSCVLGASACTRYARQERQVLPWLAFHTLRGGSLITVDGNVVQIQDMEQGGAVSQRFVGHEKPVHFVTYSLNGSRVISASQDGTARVWDAITGEELVRIVASPGAVFHTAVLDNMGEHVLTASSDGMVQLWHVQQGGARTPVLSFATTGKQSAMSAFFSPLGDAWVMASKDGHVRVVDAKTALIKRDLAVKDKHPLFAVFDPAGKRVVMSLDGRAEQACVWEIAKKELSFCLHESEAALPQDPETAAAVTFSPNGGLILTGGTFPFAQLWDAKTGLPLGTLGGHEKEVESVSFSPDGMNIASAGKGEGATRIWATAKWDKPTWVVSHAQPVVIEARLGPDGKTWAELTAAHTLRIFDAAHADAPKTIFLGSHPASHLWPCPDGTCWVTASADFVRVWSAQDGSLLHSAKIQSVGALTPEVVAFDRAGKKLAVADTQHGNVYVWNTGSWTLHAIVPVPAGKAQAIALSPSGQRLAVVTGFLPAGEVANAPSEEALVDSVRGSVSVVEIAAKKWIASWETASLADVHQALFGADEETLWTVGDVVQPWTVSTGKAGQALALPPAKSHRTFHLTNQEKSWVLLEGSRWWAGDFASLQAWGTRFEVNSEGLTYRWDVSLDGKRLLGSIPGQYWLWEMPDFSLKGRSTAEGATVVALPAFEKRPAPVVAEVKIKPPVQSQRAPKSPKPTRARLARKDVRKVRKFKTQ